MTPIELLEMVIVFYMVAVMFFVSMKFGSAVATAWYDLLDRAWAMWDWRAQVFGTYRQPWQ